MTNFLMWSIPVSFTGCTMYMYFFQNCKLHVIPMRCCSTGILPVFKNKIPYYCWPPILDPI